MVESKRDFYEVLGVPRDAEPKAVKAAFRGLAFQFHPDRNHDPGAEERFKEVAGAYAVLSDPKMRAEYDARGASGVGDLDPEDLYAGVDLEDILGGLGLDLGRFGFRGGPGRDDLFGAGVRRRRRDAEPGEDIEVTLVIPIERVVTGGEEQVLFGRLGDCGACMGTGARVGTGRTKCETCGGTGSLVALRREGSMMFRQVSTCGKCRGKGTINADPCPACGGSGQVSREASLRVDVPVGVEEGTVLRATGRGGQSPAAGGHPGDVYVIVRTAPDPRFERAGIHLRRVERIDAADAALGADREVKTIEGPVTLKIPPGIQHGTALRLRGKGLPPAGGGARGDLLVRVEVRVPVELTEEERMLYEKLRELARARQTASR